MLLNAMHFPGSWRRDSASAVVFSSPLIGTAVNLKLYTAESQNSCLNAYIIVGSVVLPLLMMWTAVSLS